MHFFVVLGTLLLNTAEKAEILPDSFDAYIQIQMMKNVFQGLPSVYPTVGQFSGKDKEVENVCQWYGVYCRSNKIRKIAWSGINLQSAIESRWIPQTVEQISFSNVSCSDVFCTHNLPRELRFLRINHGRSDPVSLGASIQVDMRKLPLKIEEFHVAYWEFFGAIDLTELPDSLVAMSLILVAIPFVQIDVEKLPKNLEPIHICAGFTKLDIEGMKEAIEKGRVVETSNKIYSKHDLLLESLMVRSKYSTLR